jgi:hypothetical protein
MLMNNYELTGEFDAALRHLEPWLRAMNLPLSMAGELQGAWQHGGAHAYWRKRLELLDRGGHCGGPATVVRAMLLMRLQDRAPALDQLERAFEDHEGALVFIAVDPCLAPLHEEPRFQALCQRIGIPLK